jgi:DNA segregation ATPase FtsK/SpoIIIE, S-DNA-T family
VALTLAGYFYGKESFMRSNTSPALAFDQLRGFAVDFARRQLLRLAGLAMIAASLFATAALATWNIGDPSLNHATGNDVLNAMGPFGAILADILTQFFGVGALPALLPMAALGITLVRARDHGSSRLRALYWLGTVLIGCAALACLSRPVTWPLPSGLGGLTGDLVMKIPALILGAYPTGFSGTILAVVLSLPGLLLLSRAMAPQGLAVEPAKRVIKPGAGKSGLDKAKSDIAADDFDEEDEDLGSSAFLGAIAHTWLSAKARFANLTGLRFARSTGSKRGFAKQARETLLSGSNQRVEPPMERAHRAPVSVEQNFEDDFEDELADELIADVGQAPSLQRSAQQRGPAVDSVAAAPKEGNRIKREAQGSLIKTDAYELPPLHVLAQPKSIVRDSRLSKEALEENARILEGVLEDFGVKGDIIHVRPGPVVTLYELEPAPGIKSSRVIGLSDDIARSMSAIACRVAVVPGRNAIGIELPNDSRETVYLREMLASKDFETTKAKLPFALGKTINGEPVIADLAKMPHLLVAGTTGSGKSVAINTMILSLLYRLTPEQCRLIMIDPKMLELSVYDGIPHLLTPVVTDPKKAVVALKWTVKEMEDRYRLMAKVGVRNIDGYNARVDEAKAKNERFSRTMQTGYDRDSGEAVYETEEFDLKSMPYIVVIIDEMADLMMVAGKDIEGTVQRLAQMARAAGIHVVMATQRPSVDVITGTIKANFPTRISFQVTSKIDSRTILGEQGAEQLLGMGDMLYMAGGGRTQRVHGPFVADNEVELVVKHLKAQGVPQYLEAVTAESDGDDDDGDTGGAGGSGDYGDSDDPYDQAVSVVLRDRKVSTSYIQRRLGIGYNRAASLIERMEEEGVISAPNHAGKREILVPEEGTTL